jgi:hypothetical protein
MEIILGLGLFIVANAPMLSGIVLPIVVDYLNREVPNPTERFIVTILAVFVTSLLIKWKSLAAGNPQEVAETMGILFFESQAVYRLYFKNSYARAKINNWLYDERRDDVNAVLPPGQ